MLTSNWYNSLPAVNRKQLRILYEANYDSGQCRYVVIPLKRKLLYENPPIPLVTFKECPEYCVALLFSLAQEMYERTLMDFNKIDRKSLGDCSLTFINGRGKLDKMRRGGLNDSFIIDALDNIKKQLDTLNFILQQEELFLESCRDYYYRQKV